jgi:hypothetical protein
MPGQSFCIEPLAPSLVPMVSGWGETLCLGTKPSQRRHVIVNEVQQVALRRQVAFAIPDPDKAVPRPAHSGEIIPYSKIQAFEPAADLAK